jgi:deazaflavin-dependent oxidoreductase (nitroreductase family)
MSDEIRRHSATASGTSAKFESELGLPRPLRHPEWHRAVAPVAGARHIRRSGPVRVVKDHQELRLMSAVTGERSPSVAARVTRSLARGTAPLTRPLAGRRFFPLWAVVHHRGRRSGRSYAVPVAIRASAATFTIPLPWGEETQWLRNVVAANGCQIRWRGGDHAVATPRLIGFEEAADAFNPALRAVLRAAGIRHFVRLDRT